MNISSLDLNLLRALDALLQTCSTVKAGQQIGLSQPAVSAALKRLRDHLGDPLLVRQGRRLVRTEFAEAISDPLRRKLDEIETLLAGAATFAPAQYEGSFRISGSDFFAELLMPALTERVAREAPGVRLHLVDMAADLDLSVLDRRLSDIALLPRITYPDWICSEPVFMSDFVVIARAGHPALTGSGVTPGEPMPLDLYCAQSHVVFSPEGRGVTMGDGALTALGRSRRVAMSLPVFSGVCRVVARTDMLALVPAAFARRLAPELGLSIFGEPMRMDTVQLDMAWHIRSDASRAHRWLREQIADVLSILQSEEDAAPRL